MEIEREAPGSEKARSWRANAAAAAAAQAQQVSKTTKPDGGDQPMKVIYLIAVSLVVRFFFSMDKTI